MQKGSLGVMLGDSIQCSTLNVMSAIQLANDQNSAHCEFNYLPAGSVDTRVDAGAGLVERIVCA